MPPEKAPVRSKKILVLTPQFPSYPPHQGTTIRNYNLIAGLARHHEVHLLSFGNPGESQGSPLEDLCHSVQVVQVPLRTMRQRITTLFFSRLPDMAHRLPSASFRAAAASRASSSVSPPAVASAVRRALAAASTVPVSCPVSPGRISK